MYYQQKQQICLNTYMHTEETPPRLTVYVHTQQMLSMAIIGKRLRKNSRSQALQIFHNSILFPTQQNVKKKQCKGLRTQLSAGFIYLFDLFEVETFWLYEWAFLRSGISEYSLCMYTSPCRSVSHPYICWDKKNINSGIPVVTVWIASPSWCSMASGLCARLCLTIDHRQSA